MYKKILIVLGVIIVALTGILIASLFLNKGDKEIYDKEIRLVVNGATFTVELASNASAEAFYEKLKEENIIINASDYNNFEKVGDLAFTLPTNDKEITTKPGDIILYQGDKIAVYYGKNTYSLTKIGRIKNTNESYLKNVFGTGNVTLEFML